VIALDDGRAAVVVRGVAAVAALGWPGVVPVPRQGRHWIGVQRIRLARLIRLRGALQHVALVLGAVAEQHALEALDRGLRVLQRQHDVHEGAEHPLEQKVLLGGEGRLGLGQEFVELGLGGVDDLGRLHALRGSAAIESSCDSRWRKSLTRG
jgi:hypothetical protein